MDHLTQQELEARLWDAANCLRGPVDPADFKAYVFPVLFFKWISDTWDVEHADAIADFGPDVSAVEEADYHRFDVPDGCHWFDVRNTTKNVGVKLRRTLDRLEAANPDKLAGIFGDVAWGNKDRLPEHATHKADYRWLAQVYESVRPSGVSDALLWHRLGAKTLAIVHTHISGMQVTGTGLDEDIVDDETIEAIRQLALPGTDAPTAPEPITVAEALDTIAARLKKRLETSGNHAVYVSLADRLERLRQASLEKAEASVEFLRELLELAKQVAAADKAEEEGGTDALSLLPDPKVGALTQILDELSFRST